MASLPTCGISCSLRVTKVPGKAATSPVFLQAVSPAPWGSPGLSWGPFHSVTWTVTHRGPPVPPAQRPESTEALFSSLTDKGAVLEERGKVMRD